MFLAGGSGRVGLEGHHHAGGAGGEVRGLFRYSIIGYFRRVFRVWIGVFGLGIFIWMGFYFFEFYFMGFVFIVY